MISNKYAYRGDVLNTTVYVFFSTHFKPQNIDAVIIGPSLLRFRIGWPSDFFMDFEINRGILFFSVVAYSTLQLTLLLIVGIVAQGIGI